MREISNIENFINSTSVVGVQKEGHEIYISTTDLHIAVVKPFMLNEYHKIPLHNKYDSFDSKIEHIIIETNKLLATD